VRCRPIFAARCHDQEATPTQVWCRALRLSSLSAPVGLRRSAAWLRRDRLMAATPRAKEAGPPVASQGRAARHLSAARGGERCFGRHPQGAKLPAAPGGRGPRISARDLAGSPSASSPARNKPCYRADTGPRRSQPGSGVCGPLHRFRAGLAVKTGKTQPLASPANRVISAGLASVVDRARWHES
jgi:hypothetical protein